MKYNTLIRRWGTGLGLATALLALPLARVHATPVIDGAIDADYTKIATSPKDNLNTTGIDVNSNPFNDQTDPVAHALDVTDLWVANTASDLYVFIEMPYLDLNVISGEWALTMHLGGANDALQRLGTVGDPYGAPITYEYDPGVNAVIKSNMAGFKHAAPNNVGFDGNQGYAFINSINHGQNDWTWDTGNFLFSQSWTDDVPNNLIHGVGNSGGEIVYKGGKGIEVKIPLSLFAANPGNTPVTAPKIGDVIRMQFYDNVRYYPAGDVVKYPRGPSDAVPFQDGVYKTDSTIGYLSQMASYTMKAPAALEVSGARLTNATDTTHLFVNFTAPLGDGAATASNYSVVNTATGAAVQVNSAVVDPADSTRVILGLDLPFSTTLHVTVSNVKSNAGSLIVPTKNFADVKIGTGVVFNLRDPYGLIARIGNDPATGAPYTITIPGEHNSWTNSATAPTAVVMTAVAGETGHFRSPIVIENAGMIGYKYSQPGLPDWDNWNALNPYDRRAVVPPSSTVVEINDNAAGSYAGITSAGPPVDITFTLVDLENKVNGKDVYLTGEFSGWSANPGEALKMEPVAGKPNTYSVTWTTPANFGQDITHKYKYLILDPISGDPADWNTLNPNGEWGGDHHIITHGTGTPLKQNVEDIVGPRSQRIARVASGMSQAPGLAGYWRELDADVSGQITLIDLVRALRP